MASGTSVLGSQLLLADGPGSAVNLYLGIQVDISHPPRRVGYLWLMQFTGDPSNEHVVLLHTPLFTGGLYYPVPPLGRASESVLRLWVDWNEPGLEWEAFAWS